jgi:hypothetical protein
MSDHCVFVVDDEDIRQGDVIRRFSGSALGEVTWGIIITADCDIAQKKAGDKFTWLEIIRSERYLECHWARDQLRRPIEKQSKVACEGLNSLMKNSALELSTITRYSLYEWLAGATVEDILRNVNTTQKPPEPKLTATLQALRIALGYAEASSQLGRLRQAWTLLGRNENNQQAAIREAFDVVPELPNTDGYGFVILLRSISSLHSFDLFKTEADARIDDRPDAFHRIGRFSDALRFSVAQ